MNYYIQGDAANADKIKAAFEKLGFDVGTNSCTQKGLYFTFDGKVCYTDDYVYARDMMLEFFIKKDPDYQELELPVEPKFEVGDRIHCINHDVQEQTITDIRDDSYITVDKYGIRCALKFAKQDEWELVPKPHYDIANFYAGMPVLVRDTEGRWSYVTFSHTYTSIDGKTYFNACGWTWSQCIPFNDETKHLLGTTDMCPEEYINW